MSASRSVPDSLTIHDATIGYEGHAVVRGASLQLVDGEIGCLLGPSGCGKSTLLRAIAGLEPLMGGEIRWGNTVFSSATFTLPPEQRGVGMVFQDIALFPHFTVAENIRFGLRKWSREAQEARIDELLQLVGLSQMRDRYPHSLSGGQQQRIALVRAMAPKPRLLLLDEPFSGLDTSLRESLVSEVRDILLHEAMSALLVTHDQAEAFAIADKVAIMCEGTLVQSGDPQLIYHQPANLFTADFIGLGGFLDGQLSESLQVQTSLGTLHPAATHGFHAGEHVRVLVRPGDLEYDEHSAYTARVTKKQFRGSHFLYHLQLRSGEKLYFVDNSHHDHALGDEIGIALVLDDVVMFSGAPHTHD